MSDEYRMLLGPTEFIEFAMILQASGCMLPEAGPGSQIGLARYLARILRVDFRANYHTLKTSCMHAIIYVFVLIICEIGMPPFCVKRKMTGHKKRNLLTMREGIIFIQYCIGGYKY